MKFKFLAAICFVMMFSFYMSINGLAEDLAPAAPATEVSASDKPSQVTIAWLNATYAILTEDMKGDPAIFAGFQKSDEQRNYHKSSLKQEWGIQKKKDVSDTILWLIGSGEREELGEDTAAWDYSRAMSVSSWAYLAGYYTMQEALDMQLAIARIIQENFSSWEEYTDSYLTGWELSCEDEALRQRRFEIYERQMAETDGPYALEWGMVLEWS